MENLSIESLAKILDLSCVKAENTYKEIEEMATLAKKYDILCVFTLPAHILYLKSLLTDRTDILIGGTVGFPSGSVTTESKIHMTRELLQNGADELDMVLNITWLKSGRYDAVRDDIRAILHEAGKIPVKVILECPYLNDEQIKIGSQIALEEGAAYIKTGTGWTEKATTIEQIKIIADTAGNNCKIKAAGGIRTLKQIKMLLASGVSRFGIGTTSARSIFREMESYHELS